MQKKIIVIGILSMFLLSTTGISAFSTKTEIQNLGTPPFEEWSKTFGGEKTDRGFFVRQTSDGGYIITGATYSFGTGGGLPDIWLIKTDSNGDKEWDKTFGDDRYDWGWCVQQTTDGGYIVLAASGSVGLIKTDSNGDVEWQRQLSGDPRFVQQTSDGGYITSGSVIIEDEGEHILLIKIDSAGNTQWKKTFKGGFGSVLSNSVQETNDGGYITIGCKSVCLLPYCWLIKTDSNGDKEWDRIFTGKIGSGFSVEQTSDGGYIISGDVTNDLFGDVDSDFWLIKTDSNGRKEWDKTFGGKDDDLGWYAQQTSDGGYMIIGETRSFGAGSDDIWLIKTDSHGNKIWHRFFGEAKSEFSHSAQQTTDGGYIITGATDSYGAGKDDLWLIKTSDFENQRPNSITIDGPPSGNVGESYVYTFSASDPDGEDVYYWIDWGDGKVKEWIGPYSPGEIIEVGHTWAKKGTYTIRAKAEDVYGGESDWATLKVTMPRNRAILNIPFLNWLQNHPNLFPILRLLFQR